MDARIEKTISNIVEYQFPQFYRSEGQTFIQFVKAYYEWMEESGNLMNRSRNILEYRDIDDTLESFLYFYQKKYLYGIPFDVIINKRYLLKHVLDVYRSKGSIQAYKLLFKLIYDQEIDIYLPGRDMLRVSDGTWKEPKYLEVSSVSGINDLVGCTIIGLSSKVTALVESYVTEPINGNIISTLYISNIQPKNGEFSIGEKIVDINDYESADLASILEESPSVIGSLDNIQILSSDINFTVGDVVKVANYDLVTGDKISFGINGLFKIIGTYRDQGIINFSIEKNGFGYMANPDVFVYTHEDDSDGNGAANFAIEDLYDTQVIDYNDDIICDYLDVSFDATEYGFPGNTAANASSTVLSALSFSNGTFGSILSLTDVVPGAGYTLNPYVFVRTVQESNTLPGSISYNTASANITGTSTEFTRYFTANSVIVLQANSVLTNTIEKQVIRSVTNNTVMTLYEPPTTNSTASATYRIAPSIMPANFATYESVMNHPDGVPGLSANVYGFVSIGNGIVNEVKVINSGKGYVEGETVKLYLHGTLADPTIVDGGINYSNGDILIFSGGNPGTIAAATVRTNGNGTINTITMSAYGSSYESVPTITVRSSNGSGAQITTSIVEYDDSFKIVGKVTKGGIGKQKGFWSTTRGFLNSDKYIQDSYFYQDFSYQIQAAITLNKYSEILYNTFHIAGTELFGKYLVINSEESNMNVLYESNSAIIT